MIKCKLHPGQKNKSLIILLTEPQLSANTCTDRMLMLRLSYSDPSPAARTELQQLTSQAAAFFPTCSCFSSWIAVVIGKTLLVLIVIFALCCLQQRGGKVVEPVLYTQRPTDKKRRLIDKQAKQSFSKSIVSHICIREFFPVLSESYLRLHGVGASAQPVCMSFVNLQKESDRVPWSILWEVLLELSHFMDRI